MPLTAAEVAGPATACAGRVGETTVIPASAAVCFVAPEVGLTPVLIERVAVAVACIAGPQRAATIHAPRDRPFKIAADAAATARFCGAELCLTSISVSAVTVCEGRVARRHRARVIFAGAGSVIEVAGARVTARSAIVSCAELGLTPIFIPPIAVGPAFHAAADGAATTSACGFSVGEGTSVPTGSAMQLII